MLTPRWEYLARPRRLLGRKVAIVVSLACLPVVPACSDGPAGTQPDRTAIGEPSTGGSAPPPESVATSDVPTTVVPPAAGQAGPSTTPAPEPTPAIRTFGVVLTDPSIYDPLNVRDVPGVQGTIIQGLAPTQTGFRPTVGNKRLMAAYGIRSTWMERLDGSMGTT